MIRRAFLLVVAAAFALILAPTVAMAYPAAVISCTVSNPSPTSGVAFTVDCTGVGAGQAVSLTPSGGQPLANTSDANGAVSFPVTLNQTGNQTLVVNGASGEVLSTLSVNVGGVGAVAAAGTGAGGLLANTGNQPLGLAVGGGLLVLVGAGAVLVTRRRKSAKVTA